MFHYPSLAKERELISYLSQTDDDTTKWIVTEKMHGLNLQFLVQEHGNITCFRRNGQLIPGDKFYGWERVLEECTGSLLKVRARYGADVRVFGELIGGIYPGMKTSPQDFMIQGEVKYCPDNRFVVFDIYDCQEKRFLDFYHMRELAMDSGLFVVQPWYSGLTFAQVLQLDHEQENSRIPDMFGLVPPPIANNIIEGWVIRPEREPEGKERRLIKRRTCRYMDIKAGTAKDYEAPPTRVNRHRANHETLIAEFSVYLNSARVRAVMSKELEPTVRLMNTYIQLVFEDILQEWNPTPIELPDKVRGTVRGMVAKMIRELYFST